MGDITTFLESKDLDDLDDLNMGGDKIIEKNIKTDSNQKISYQKRKELEDVLEKRKIKYLSLKKKSVNWKVFAMN